MESAIKLGLVSKKKQCVQNNAHYSHLMVVSKLKKTFKELKNKALQY
jgi:hypothetical protein